MSDAFALAGVLSVTPISGPTSGDWVATTPLDEQMVLAQKIADTLTLTVDSAVNVPFGGVTNAHIVALKVIGGPVTARFTSAAGVTQSIPFDSFLFLTSGSVPFTAIDLTRAAGTTTYVKYFLGQKA